MNEIFKSDRYFIMFDFLISHGKLLLRSQKTEEPTSNNIDIIFTGTSYIQLNPSLKGIQINRSEDIEKIPNYNSIKKELSYDYIHLFEIISNNEKYYVTANNVIAFENKLEFSESSLFKEKGIKIASSKTNSEGEINR